jgi:hypothetical protein
MKRWRDTIARDRLDRDRVSDIFFAFAQTCYHMVDWLENDGSQPIRRAEWEKHVMASRALSYCSDICNGSKHARLQEKGIELSEQMSLAGAYREHIEGSGSDAVWRERQVFEAKLYLEWEGEAVLALDFADRCIAEWDDLLRAKGLL